MNEAEKNDPKASPRTLKATFLKIRRDYFPGWDRAQEWKVGIKSNMPRSGWCDSERKRIWVSSADLPQAELELLLIHEVCHFVQGSHGSVWQSRMIRAATRAAELERNDLAALLLKEVLTYQISIKETPFSVASIYSDLDDFLMMRPDSTFKEAISAVALKNGLFVTEMKRFKRCRTVFLEAKQRR